jgi:hypothetical protein
VRLYQLPWLICEVWSFGRGPHEAH